MSNSTEKALKSPDIWENIFEYFNLREQLQLTHVCSLFHHVITSLTWKRKYKELKLYVIKADKILVTEHVDNIEKYNAYSDPMYKFGYNDCNIVDVADRTSSILDYEEILELLAMNSNNIRKLQIIDKTNALLGLLMKNRFDKLSVLILCGIEDLCMDNLKRIHISCRQLKTLILTHCFSKYLEGILQDLNCISVMANMIMLKTLIVTDERCNYAYNHILVVIKYLQHLSQLVLKINIVSNGSDINSDMTTLKRQDNLCEVLRIGLDQQTLKIITKSLLQNFEHLSVLVINGHNSPLTINRQFLENLTKHCKHLKNLYLEFCHFDDFIAVPSLETLTLVNCSDLSWLNFKSILKQANLRSFTSVFSRFSNNFEYFYIESPLEYLHIETLEYDYREDFVKFLTYNSRNLNKLHTLIWHDYTLYAFELMATYLPLKENFHNLHTLFIDLSVVNFADLMEMKCLKELAFVENDSTIDLGKLLTIINHSTLESFIVYSRNLECSTKSPISPLSTFKTNLKLIHIPLDIFNKHQNIWLQLLSENPKLQMICYFYEQNAIDFTYLKDLFENDKFPARIKSIKMSDFIIDCKNFRQNAEVIKTIILTAKQYSKQFKETMFLKL